MTWAQVLKSVCNCNLLTERKYTETQPSIPVQCRHHGNGYSVSCAGFAQRWGTRHQTSLTCRADRFGSYWNRFARIWHNVAYLVLLQINCNLMLKSPRFFRFGARTTLLYIIDVLNFVPIWLNVVLIWWPYAPEIKLYLTRFTCFSTVISVCLMSIIPDLVS